MNYSELLTNVRNYSEVTNTENRIARQLDSDDQRRYATSATQANNSFLDVSGPEGGFRFARALQLVKSDDTRVWLQQRDATFMDEYS